MYVDTGSNIYSTKSGMEDTEFTNLLAFLS